MNKRLRTKLIAGQHDCVGTLEDVKLSEGEAPQTSQDYLDKACMLVYCGKFMSMDGEVEITEDHIDRLVASHNARMSKVQMSDGKTPYQHAPPVQLDHSPSATMTVGRLVGRLYKGTYPIDDHGSMVPALYIDRMRILGKENVEKVKDGRWTHVSIGADLEEGSLNELSITPFPAAAHAQMLAARKRLDAADTKVHSKGDYKGEKYQIEHDADVGYTGYAMGKQVAENCKTADEALKKIKEAIDKSKGKLSGGTMYEKLKQFLMGSKKLSEKDADEKLKKMSEEEQKKLSEEATESETVKKEKLKKHLMDEKKCSEEEADEHLSKMSDDDKEKLSKTIAEREANLAQEAEKADKEAKMAAKTKFVALAKGMKAATSEVQLAAKTAKVAARLAKLRTDLKITPAELKKKDLIALAKKSDAEIDAELKSYEDREPVLDTNAYGTSKAVNLAQIAAKYKMARLEIETRMNMPSKRDAAQAELKALEEKQKAELAALAKEDPDHDGDEHGESSYDSLMKMVDEGRDKEAIKAAIKKMMDEGKKEMSSGSSDAEKRMSALAETVNQLQTQFSDLITLVGSSLGVETKDLE